MTITYAYFRTRATGKLSKTHAFDNIVANRNYPICCSYITMYNKDRIITNRSEIHVTDLCKNCQKYLSDQGINWFINKPPDIRTIAEKIKATNQDLVEKLSDNRGDSLEVKVSSKTTKIMSFTLEDYKVSITLFDGKFNSGTLKQNKSQRTITIPNKDSLVQLFTVIYRPLELLDLLPCEIIEGMEQLIFENKNK